ncbi:MAG: chorismate-binding protein [Prevotellaceae bacterium]|jgi:isochorismate synthase|nr:chorismate-binding protein [Prevotellaceae bacterium]
MQHFNLNIAFVAYRLPNSNEIRLLEAETIEKFRFSGQENLFTEESFIVVPFDNENRTAYRLRGKETLFNTTQEGKPAHTSDRKTQIAPSLLSEELKGAYFSAFEKIKAAIYAGTVQKAILARQQVVENIISHRATDFFLHLCEAQPAAYCYLLNLPGEGVWLGASPELFLRRKDREMNTVSLAGTKKSAAAWSEKEVDEQAIVSRYIENILNSFGIKNFEREAVATVSASGVEHLKTVFHFPAAALSGKAGAFAAALHPSPAVCGYPKEAAKQLIIHTEQHDRALYSGFLGKVAADGNFELFVNIRCMQLIDNKAIVYAGGGITAQSEAEAEFAETELKAKFLVDLLV